MIRQNGKAQEISSYTVRINDWMALLRIFKDTQHIDVQVEFHNHFPFYYSQ